MMSRTALLWIIAVSVSACLETVSEEQEPSRSDAGTAGDSGIPTPSDRVYGPIASSDIDSLRAGSWLYGVEPPRQARVPNIRILDSGDILVGSISGTLLADGGYIPSQGAFISEHQASWLFDSGWLFTASETYRATAPNDLFARPPIRLQLWKRNTTTTQLSPHSDFVWSPTLEQGKNAVFGLFHSEQSNRMWISRRVIPCDTNHQGFAEAIDDNNTNSREQIAGSLSVEGELKTDDTFVTLLTDECGGGLIRRGKKNTATLEHLPTSCIPAHVQNAQSITAGCADSDGGLIVASANKTHTTLDKYSIPAGHQFVALIEAVPLGFVSRRGNELHLCEADSATLTTCQKITNISAWPPALGVAGDDILVGSYQFDGGFLLQSTRKALK